MREWDSCFTTDFTYIHGGSVRSSTRSRYRQWMTHKLATWFDQFGTSGCVGCGRCITWCPVAIDITEEAAVIRATDGEARMSDVGRGIGELLAEVADHATASTRAHLELIAGCGRDPVVRRRASGSSREGEPADAFYVIRHGRVALEIYVPGRGRRDRRDARRRRDRGLVLAGPALRVAPRRARAGARLGRRVRRRLPAREVRGRPDARLRDDEALRAPCSSSASRQTRVQMLDVYGRSAPA